LGDLELREKDALRERLVVENDDNPWEFIESRGPMLADPLLVVGLVDVGVLLPPPNIDPFLKSPPLFWGGLVLCISSS
jgi:hypothetical protein